MIIIRKYTLGWLIFSSTTNLSGKIIKLFGIQNDTYRNVSNLFPFERLGRVIYFVVDVFLL